MTECERIIKEGILPASFFKPETICDFYVDETRKKIWAIEIDLLLTFDKRCREIGVKYHVSFGGLLGIVRHEGFIPWDDDLDVCMLREDYEKFVSVYKDTFKYPYYFQQPGKDKGYYFSFSRLCNSNTTCIPETFKYQEYNHGVSLDIFVLDNCIEDQAESNFIAIRSLILENSANMRRSNPYPSENDLKRIEQFPKSDAMDVVRRIDEICQRYNNIDTKKVILAQQTFYHYSKMIWDKNDVTELMDVDFYGHKVVIPKNYSKILEVTYGRYMDLPPVEKRGSWHSNVFWDLDHSYIKYCDKLWKN